MNSKPTLLLALAFTALLSLESARAQTTTFNVDLNTAFLSVAPNDSFSLELQLNPGNGSTSSNTATVSNFQFSGGGGIAGTVVDYSDTPASATGDFADGFSLSTNPAFTPGQDDVTDPSHPELANGFAIIDQNFDASVTDIKFTVTVSDWTTGTAPTDFIAAIYDNTINNYVQTTDPVAQLSLVTVDLGRPGNAAVAQDYAITAVPEPSTYALSLMAGLAFLVIRRRFLV